jgi:hypothetical protein
LILSAKQKTLPLNAAGFYGILATLFKVGLQAATNLPTRINFCPSHAQKAEILF